MTENEPSPLPAEGDAAERLYLDDPTFHAAVHHLLIAGQEANPKAAVVRALAAYRAALLRSGSAPAAGSEAVAWRYRYSECEGAPWGDWHLTDDDPEGRVTPGEGDEYACEVQPLGVLGAPDAIRGLDHDDELT